ncbi:signal recognition particle protein [Salicibibacter kimchii]|uniref:Signal recognition particle protein n=1 Tax=Salicibibacter kimchii TaxID=2099786 RepID=A0A345BWT4_9BACI|nr:signal recognition particle protein [Salicibibacter kimchii]AXF55415.1 signal recognition particle protein [Salicibibacter kimchii]
MAFEGLAERLQATMSKIKGKGKVSEADVKEMAREVRLALLEADVNFKVVKQFVGRIKERAVGQEVMKSLTPGQQVIKVVNEELTALMGKEESKLAVADKAPTVIMMVGLQGSGKTTTAAKLANHLRKEKNRNPMLVAADVYRPAAIDQLQTLGKQLEMPVFSKGTEANPVDIVREGVEQAKAENHDYVLLDTAGRLHVDEALMDELQQMSDAVEPHEVLLVVDAMTGQDAVNVAEQFNDQLPVSGVVLTKLDGDTRGGAALSIRAVTEQPIKFAGMGEKIDQLETFHPERMASRILGMGDMLSLIEKAQTNVDEERAKELEKKMRNADLTFEDFLEQLEQVKSMGPMEDILSMMPGAGKMKGMKNMQVDESQIGRIEAIVRSMTKAEKQDPKLMNASRKRRIAKGSGTSVQDVNKLLKQFEDMKKMMKQMSSMGGGKKKGKGGMQLPFMR